MPNPPHPELALQQCEEYEAGSIVGVSLRVGFLDTPQGSKYPIIIYSPKTCTMFTSTPNLRTELLGTLRQSVRLRLSTPFLALGFNVWGLV